MFEGMSFEKFINAVNPKMKGALALHNALRDTPLDFFVMTSSISAVLGNPGQANYCAGNSYLDSLALYRRKRGLAASSIALPMVLDVGVVAENSEIEDSLTRKGLYGIDEGEMLAAFEAGMRQGPPTADEGTSSDKAQIVLGLEPVMVASAMASADQSDIYWVHDSRLASVRTTVDSINAELGKQKQGNSAGFVATLTGLSESEMLDAIGKRIVERCARILMLPSEKFDMEGSSVASHGVDLSLIHI